MPEYTKQSYSIGEVSRMLEVPIYTLRFWEDQFPMFNPGRSAKGTRRFSPADIDLATRIRELLYDRGMRIEGAIEHINKTYRRLPPRRLRVCKTPKDALALLAEVKSVLDDAHSIAKIEALEGWAKTLPDPATQAPASSTAPTKEAR